MAERTVTGTILHPIGGAPWDGARVVFYLLTPFGAGSSSYPGDVLSTTTDAAGTFETALAVPNDVDAAARYRVLLPFASLPANAVEFNLAAGAPIDLAEVLAAALSEADPNSLLTLIDAHAAVIAQIGVLGHIKPDGTTITVDPDGTAHSPFDAALSIHEADSTNVHGIVDTGALILTSDARLSDARTPTAHASSHASAGSDPLSPAAIGAAPLGHTHAGIPQVIPIRAAYSTQTWASMPLALTEFNANTQGRVKCDLTSATQARLIVKLMGTIGAAGSEIRAQYSTDETNWFYLDNVSGPAAAINSANTTLVSSWINLASGAKADVFLRVVGVGGDGAASPSFGNINVQVR